MTSNDITTVFTVIWVISVVLLVISLELFHSYLTKDDEDNE